MFTPRPPHTPAYAILRVRGGRSAKGEGAPKIKSYGALRRAEHYAKQHDSPHADPDKRQENMHVLDKGDYVKTTQRRLHDLHITPRQGKDPQYASVLVIEYNATASPPFFKDIEPGTLGQWLHKNVQFFEELHGRENLLGIELHRDQGAETPHLHVFALPIDDHNHLNARHFTGGAARLSHLQDRYAGQMGDLGLERGTRGSEATHEAVSEWVARKDQEAGPVPYARDFARTIRDAATLDDAVRIVRQESPRHIAREAQIWERHHPAPAHEAEQNGPELMMDA